MGLKYIHNVIRLCCCIAMYSRINMPQSVPYYGIAANKVDPPIRCGTVCM